MNEEIERLVAQMAKENPGWGNDRIVGAMANLGQRLSDQTVGNILRRHGLSPAPMRKQALGTFANSKSRCSLRCHFPWALRTVDLPVQKK
jgi:hypothetical protein